VSTLLEPSAPDRVFALADTILRLPAVGILITKPADLGVCVPCTYSKRHAADPQTAVADVVDRHPTIDPEQPFAFGHTPCCVEHLTAEVAYYVDKGAVVHLEIPLMPRGEVAA
jgi:hypothetical protein